MEIDVLLECSVAGECHSVVVTVVDVFQLFTRYCIHLLVLYTVSRSMRQLLALNSWSTEHAGKFGMLDSWNVLLLVII